MPGPTEQLFHMSSNCRTLKIVLKIRHFLNINIQRTLAPQVSVSIFFTGHYLVVTRRSLGMENLSDSVVGPGVSELNSHFTSLYSLFVFNQARSRLSSHGNLRLKLQLFSFRSCRQYGNVVLYRSSDKEWHSRPNSFHLARQR
jgi:hypothetical protein